MRAFRIRWAFLRLHLGGNAVDKTLVDALIGELTRLRAQLEQPAARPEIGGEQASWLASVLENSSSTIGVLDADGRLIYLNRTMPWMTPSQVIGKRPAEFMPEPSRTIWAAAFARVLATGNSERVEIFSTGDRWWETRLAAIAQDGQPRRILSIGVDITDQKANEAALRVRDEELRIALQASGMGLWRWDVGTDRVLWDEATRKIFDWPIDTREVTRAEYVSRIHPEDVARVRAHIADSVERRQYSDLEHRLLLPDGKVRFVHATARVLTGPTGEATQIVGGVIDVTSARLAEAANERARKLEAIGQLAGGVAHDFNNLLLVITGNIDLALPHVEAGAQPLLRDALDGANRAAELTRQLLTFGRRQALLETPLELNDMIGDTVKLLRRLIPESIEIDFIKGHRLPRARGDRGQLEQVFINLCVNARDAMPSGGRLVIETETVVVNGKFRESHPWARPGRYLLISVSDTGSGIAPEVIERIFEPYFTTKEHGTGLGLATVYGIVKQHGGLITAYSEAGKGSTFKVYLPASDRDAADVGTKIDIPVRGGTETVLLAEDEAAVRSVVVRILERVGYRVLQAVNGHEAIELFLEHQAVIDLVILDAIMPRVGGYDALQRIRGARPLVPAIISSGYTDSMVTHAGPGAPADGAGFAFVPKPYEPDALLRAVRRLLDERPPR